MRNKLLLTLLLLPVVLVGCTAKTDDTTEPEVTTYTLEQIAEHAAREDCWMAIDGKVYDFTDYIPEHPAGGAMVKACGTEGTQMYDDVPHSEYADTLFEPYYIGELAE